MKLYKQCIKRLFDIYFSFIGLIVFIPLFVMVSILIKIESKGTVLFTQVRIGKNFKPFNLYKFRSMVMDAPKIGLPITTGSDTRITKIGRFLRKTKIDELPQFFNVLKGDMSFVGPRPELLQYVEIFQKEYEEVLMVRPGITDLASLKYRDETSILGKTKEPEKEYVCRILPEKIRLAKEYLKRSSLILDLSIIFKTLIKLVIIKKSY
ncbi:MAG: sugar transferase [Candidatus Scalindua sp.]